MTTALFDVQAGFGGSKAGDKDFVTADDWTEEMTRLSISRALVRTAPDDLDKDVPASNEILFKACEGHEDLVPCPVIVPSGGGDLPPEDEQAADMIARGAGAACVRPRKDCWNLKEWLSSALFSALEERALPAYCIEGEVTLEELAGLAERHPRLPFILAGVEYRSQRVLVPLLETFPNVHMSIGSNLAVHGGVEQFARRVGPERLLFGTGFPDAEPMMAVTMLAYADLSGEEKALIGSGNMERLLGGISR